jgi:hypothetical protein
MSFPCFLEHPRRTFNICATRGFQIRNRAESGEDNLILGKLLKLAVISFCPYPQAISSKDGQTDMEISRNAEGSCLAHHEWERRRILGAGTDFAKFERRKENIDVFPDMDFLGFDRRFRGKQDRKQEG